MAIFRGDGGSGDATTDAYASQIAQDAQTATTKANEAAASATAAASSASAASTSESNASTSETNAASSASSASTSASNASTSETNAASSASSASTSASNAATSETNAATSETNAATSATSAASSASTATTQASAASASATAAANSASAAATSETNAATSATNASTSETNAASSATSAAASYDSFDDRYLGTKASDPSTDNDGDSLVTGALYFNTTAGEMRVYNGSSWLAAYLPGTAYLQLAGGTMTGALTLNADPSTNLQAATKQYVDTIAAASLHYHDPVRVEKEGNLSATYNNGTAGVGATLTNNSTQAALVIDGVTLALNDRVLIYEQTNAFENGIYTVTDTGSASTNWVLTRATDADSYAPSDSDSLGEGDAFYVLEGTLGAGELYVMNTSGAITFGTTAINFAQVSSAQVYTGGTGITISGSEISTTALLNVVEDTTPQLGGALSANGFNINMGTYTITDTKVGQWDTAYGWGDHSAAGYLTSYTETDTLDSVTGRGATTTNAVTVGNLTSTGIDDNATSTALTIDASQNVGIGTASPTAKLRVNTPVNTTSTRLGDDAAPTRDLIISSYNVAGYNGAGWDFNANGQSAAGTISFSTNATERMRIGSSGNVGINSSAPIGRLDISHDLVDGSLDFTKGLVFSSDGGVGGARFAHAGITSVGSSPYNGSLVFGTDGGGTSSTTITERMRIDSSGNVGIGTASPLSNVILHIAQTTAEGLPASFPVGGAMIQHNQTSGYGAGLYIIGGSTGYSTVLFGDKDSSTQGEVRYKHSNDSFAFYTNASERMRLDSAGDLGINITNPTEKLHVGGNILATGNITAYSDERLKSDVKTLDGSKVYEMRGVSFTKDGEDGSGVIAQELQKVAPELVNDSGEYLSVAYGNLVGYLIEAVKELKAEIEELKNGSSD